MKKIKIVEFESQYTEQAKKLARLAMEDVGIKPDVVDLYIEDDFDYESILDVYKNRSRLWVALAEDNVIGTIAISEIDVTTARLRRMFVLPQAQGEGIGQKLFATAMRFAKEKAYNRIVLDTDKDMYKAQRFYEKNGFYKVRDEGNRLFYERVIL
jgi:GNAT superfamily N-acetyltransferase